MRKVLKKNIDDFINHDVSNEENIEHGFISHLVELRIRIIKAVLSIFFTFISLLIFPGPSALYNILANPMLNSLPEGAYMVATGVTTPFMVPIKVTLMVSFVLMLPVTLYQAWSFIAPGLYKHERKIAFPLILSATLLFVVGMIFCHFFVFQTVFRFIAAFSPRSIVPAPDIEAYISFVMTMFFAFGITFEVPIVVFFLVRTGITSLVKLKSMRGYFIVAAFTVSAIVTPPDVLSQFMLAVPLCLLYELGLFFVGILSKNHE